MSQSANHIPCPNSETAFRDDHLLATSAFCRPVLEVANVDLAVITEEDAPAVRLLSGAGPLATVSAGVHTLFSLHLYSECHFTVSRAEKIISFKVTTQRQKIVERTWFFH